MFVSASARFFQITDECVCILHVKNANVMRNKMWHNDATSSKWMNDLDLGPLTGWAIKIICILTSINILSLKCMWLIIFQLTLQLVEDRHGPTDIPADWLTCAKQYTPLSLKQAKTDYSLISINTLSKGFFSVLPTLLIVPCHDLIQWHRCKRSQALPSTLHGGIVICV